MAKNRNVFHADRAFLIQRGAQLVSVVEIWSWGASVVEDGGEGMVKGIIQTMRAESVVFVVIAMEERRKGGDS